MISANAQDPATSAYDTLFVSVAVKKIQVSKQGKHSSFTPFQSAAVIRSWLFSGFEI